MILQLASLFRRNILIIIKLLKLCAILLLVEKDFAEFLLLNSQKCSDAAIVIFPGGAYRGLADHEGRGYAEFLNENGITAFVVNYRVAPHKFPLDLLDARRAVRWGRAHAGEYGICKDKIAVMGSSAGGHLTALVSTYRGAIDHEGMDAVDREEYLPNAQILCYPVICNPAEPMVIGMAIAKLITLEAAAPA